MAAGVREGGQFSTEARSEADVHLTSTADTPFTARYDTLDEKIAAFHTELESQVAALDSDENWLAYLNTASQFHHYSGGGVGVFERREFSPSCANPAIEWAQSGAHIAVETLAGVSDLDAAT